MKNNKKNNTKKKYHVLYSYFEDGNLMEDDLKTFSSEEKAKEYLVEDFKEQYDVESRESERFDAENSKLEQTSDYGTLLWDDNCVGIYRIVTEGYNFAG